MSEITMLNEAPVKDKQVTTTGKPHKKQQAPKSIPKQMVANVKSNTSTDGIDHINIDNNWGKTELGRLLANFPKTPFVHPEYGPFASIEGFWHWIRSANPSDDLRGLFGNRARAFGRKLNNGIFVENFKEEIIKAIYYKIVQNANIYDDFVASTLPFKYYYIFGPKQIEISPDYAKWLCDGIEQIRDHLKKFGKDGNNPFIYSEK